MKRLFAIALVGVLLCGCSAQTTAGKAIDAQSTLFCMDTVMELQFWGKDAAKADEQVTALLQDIETTWAADGKESVVPLLDNVGDPETGVMMEGITGSQQTLLTARQEAVVQKALELSSRTNGAFDPRLYDLTSLWGFTTGDYRVPSQEEIRAALGSTRWDLGALIKGYAGQQAAELLQTLDVDCALLNLGGNVQTYGSKANGTPWNIAIRDPEKEDGTVGILAVEGTACVITSGGYQRCFESEGVRYHHILDPQTGYPANNDLASVTVICTDGMTGDALSTALFVMGFEKAVEHWRESDDFEAVFVMTSGGVFATEGTKLSGGSYEVIKR